MCTLANLLESVKYFSRDVFVEVNMYHDRILRRYAAMVIMMININSAWLSVIIVVYIVALSWLLAQSYRIIITVKDSIRYCGIDTCCCLL